MLAFLEQQRAANGQNWTAYCGQARPMIQADGFIGGPWGECMHAAVLFEQQNPQWADLPGYEEDGPAGQVLNFLNQCGYGDMSDALSKNEDATRERVAAGSTAPVFQTSAPTIIGQPVAGVPVPAGTAGTGQVVVGVPLMQRAQQEGVPEGTKMEEVGKGASIIESHPHFPEERPMKDVPFAICFLITVVIVIALLAMHIGEIPRLVSMVATNYEAFPNMTCGKSPIDSWEDGKDTQVKGIMQRFSEDDTDGAQRRLDFASNELELEVPGLSDFRDRLELLTMGVVSFEEIQPSRQLRATNRRRRTDKPPPPAKDRDCERACAAYEACAGFDVVGEWETKDQVIYTCIYHSEMLDDPVASNVYCSPYATNYTCSACWRKQDTEEVEKLAGSIMTSLFACTLVGAVVAIVGACGYVKFTASNTKEAVYCAVYGIPGCMIVTGLWLIVVLTPFAAPLLVVGLILMCCGGCVCACNHCCYKDAIPLTIEVLIQVSQLVIRYTSLLWIGLIGGMSNMLWTFMCILISVGSFAKSLREQATVPVSQGGGSITKNGPLSFISSVIYFWGGYVALNVCHTAFCGVFGRWYFKEGDDLPPDAINASLKVSCVTSFGSICMGSLAIAIIRALEQLARQMERNAAENGQAAAAVIACILQYIIGLIGDILEWFSEWVYVQVAVRGIGFIDGCRATYALACVGNLRYIVSAIITDLVACQGSLCTGLVGGVVAGLLGYTMSSIPVFAIVLAIIGGILGCCAGCCSGGASISVLHSGSQSILMCWAERPDVLQNTHPDLHERFVAVCASGRETENANFAGHNAK